MGAAARGRTITRRLIRRSIALVTLVSALQVGARASTAYTPYNYTLSVLNGYWIFHMLPAMSFSATAPGDPGGVATAPRQDILRVGFIHLDGLGNADGRTIATTADNTGNTVIIDFTWTGTYTLNQDPYTLLPSGDGTGTLSITPTVTDASCTPRQSPGVCATFEGNQTYAFVFSKRTGQISLNETDNAGGGAKIFLTGDATRQWTRTYQWTFAPGILVRRWSFQLRPAVGFAAVAPGDPGGVATAPRQNLLIVGYAQFDGIGGALGRMVATTDDDYGSTVVIDFPWTGSYAINADGTGVLTVTPQVSDDSCTPQQPKRVCATFETDQTYAFAVSKSHVQMFLAETDNATEHAKIFLSGTAALQ